MVDRLENGFLIFPRVDELENSIMILIRRITFEDSYMIAKDVMLPNGEWINVPEGTDYPKSAYLKSAYYVRDAGCRVFNWPR